MRLRTPLLALAIASALPFAGEAAACIYQPVVRIGPEPSARELAEEEARYERELRGGRRARAEAMLAVGADPATLLAEMLVPNIRPIRIRRSDCGPVNEIDPGPGEDTPEDWLRGTRLEGRAEELAPIWRMDGRNTLGATCNGEFRGRFAAHLRHRLTARQMRESYLFLGSYWEPPRVPAGLRWRLTRFAPGTRRPPVQWYEVGGQQAEEITRWTRRVATGRALNRAIEDFWRDAEPILDDTARACPEAAARWPAEQARLVDELEAPLLRRQRARRAQPAR